MNVILNAAKVSSHYDMSRNYLILIFFEIHDQLRSS